MTNLSERILTSENFQKAASVLPILMGLIPRQKSDYFELRESIITKTKNRAVKIFEDGKIRKADKLMVKAQEQNDRLREDKDYVENYQARVEFAQKPLRKKYIQMSFHLKEKPKTNVLKSDEEILFEQKMNKAQNTILKLIERIPRSSASG